MITSAELDEYMDEIRWHVCSRCIERVPGGPPCAPLGKRCGIELHLEQLVASSLDKGIRSRAGAWSQLPSGRD